MYGWMNERKTAKEGWKHYHYMHVLSTTFIISQIAPTKLSHKQVPYKLLYISMQQSAELALLLLMIIKDISNCWLWTTHWHKYKMRVKLQTTRLPYHIYFWLNAIGRIFNFNIFLVKGGGGRGERNMSPNVPRENTGFHSTQASSPAPLPPPPAVPHHPHMKILAYKTKKYMYITY